MLQVNFEPLCAILILSRNSLCNVYHVNHRNHANIEPLFMFSQFPAVHTGVCEEKILSTNIYLNLFLNISFVLIHFFCYYHATVIENIVNTRSIMYLAFAIFSIEMYNYHLIRFLFYFLGDVLNLLMCLVFLIAVLCFTFSDEKNIDMSV